MARIAPVRLQHNPKVLWFDAGDLDIQNGDALILSTARGVEYGHAAGDVFEATEEQIENLKSPLRPVERLATPEDDDQLARMRKLSEEALPIFREMAAETNETMHPVMVEYLFDGNKAVFLFESEERADFRELVRRLTAHFHVRVDMRQIGVRDEARIIGGLGHCGQELCCCRLGGEFCPVSIRMAKAQDLSLNPQQISGLCGRLMCCLRYEYDYYKEYKSRAPKQNATIETPDGPMKVAELDTLHEVVVLRNEDGKKFRIPLSEFDPPEEGMNRPKSIGDAFFEYANAADSGRALIGTMGTTENFTVEDKLADGPKVRHNPTRKSLEAEEAESHRKSSRRRRRRKSTTAGSSESNAGSAAKSDASGEKKTVARRPGMGSRPAPTPADGDGEKKPSSNRNRHRRRRGGSSHKQGAASGSGSGVNSSVKKDGRSGAKPNGSPKPTGDGSSHRKARRRSHKAGGTQSE